MTRPAQKLREQFMVSRVGELLGRKWTVLASPEPPDFLLQDEQLRIGLEVTEIFRDDPAFSTSSGKKGSNAKAAEQYNQKRVNKIRDAYMHIDPEPASVRLVGEFEDSDYDNIIPTLLLAGLKGSTSFRSQRAELFEGGPCVYYRRAFQSEWTLASDRVGAVTQDPTRISMALQRVVQSKFNKVQPFMRSNDIPVSLLIYCNRLHNSGKVDPQSTPIVSNLGFDRIYFYSYPDDVVYELTEA